MEPQAEPTTTMSFRLPDDLAEKLRNQAQSEDLTVSQLMRRIIRYGIKKTRSTRRRRK